MFYHIAPVMHLGKIIKKIRIHAELTQQQLGERINKTKALVSHIENSGKVNYYTLQQIATALDTSIEFIQEYEVKTPTSFLAKPTYTSEGSSQYLPKDYELIKQENKMLKEQIRFLQKQNTQLIAAMAKDK